MGKYFNIAALSHADPQGDIYKYWGELLKPLCEKADIILMPEACNRDQGSSRKEEGFFAWLSDFSKRYAAWIAGCAYENNYNKLCLFNDKGERVYEYAKTFLYPDEAAVEGVTYGKGAEICETKYGRIGGAICFDINFEEIRRQYKKLSPNLMLFSSVFDGGVNRMAWAHSLRCYLVSSVMGKNAGVMDPQGEIVPAVVEEGNYIITRINTDCTVVHLDYNLQKLSLLENTGCVIVDKAVNNGTALVTCLDHDMSVKDLLQKYHISSADDYIEDCRQKRLLGGGEMLC